MVIAMAKLSRAAEVSIFSFNDVYAEYLRFAEKSIESAFSKVVCFKAFEHLGELQLVGNPDKPILPHEPVRLMVTVYQIEEAVQAIKVNNPTKMKTNMEQWALSWTE